MRYLLAILICLPCMAQILPVDTAIVVTVGPVIDDTDFSTLEVAVAYNATGMSVDLIESSGTASTKTDLTLTTAGSNDWTHLGNGIYEIEITAAQNNTEGNLQVVGECDGVLPFFSPVYTIVPTMVYNSLALGTDNLEVDTLLLSGDSTAANNLESMYDATGYTDATAPASRAQVDAIGAASGGALMFQSSADNTGGAIKSVTFVGTQTGTYTNTEAEDGSYHQISPSTNDLDIVYQFDIGGGRTGVDFSWTGYLNGNGDDAVIQAYDFVGTDWETIATIDGQSGSTNVSLNGSLLNKHTGTGSDIGAVLLRIDGQNDDTAPVLYTDQFLVSAVSIGQSVGYSGGYVYLDTDNGTSGTESFVNGTADNPCSTWSEAVTIAGNVGLYKLDIVGDVTLSSGAEGNFVTIFSHRGALALGSQNIGGVEFLNFEDITGVGTNAASDRPVFRDSTLGGAASCTIPPSALFICEIGAGSLVLGSAGDYDIDFCSSGVAGTSAATVDCNSLGSATTVGLSNYSRGLILNNLTTNHTVTVHGVLTSLTLNGADATVQIGGQYGTLTNNLTGSPSVTTTNSYDISGANTTFASILADTSEIGTAGAGLTAIPWNASWDAEVESEATDALNAYDPPTDTEMDSGFAGLNNLSAAEVNAEVDTALADIHLDHLLAADYDPASKPGTATALLNELMENDGGVSRFTANALEQAPSGGGGGDATAANQTTIITHLTDIKGATWSSSTDTLEEIADAIATIDAGAGTGDTSVNHDTGGTDELRIVDGNGNGIVDATILAYVASAYASNPLTATVQATATTGADGRWEAPMMLDSGTTYTLYIYKQGVYGPATTNVTP